MIGAELIIMQPPELRPVVTIAAGGPAIPASTIVPTLPTLYATPRPVLTGSTVTASNGDNLQTKINSLNTGADVDAVLASVALAK